jgi:hypothetical protein
MGELPFNAHAIGGNSAPMGRDEIHQTKTDRLHARMGSNVKSAVHRTGRLDQNMQRQIGRTRLQQCCLGVFDIGHGFHLGHHDVRQA